MSDHTNDWREFLERVVPPELRQPLSNALKDQATDEHLAPLSEQELWDRLHPNLRDIITGDDPA